MICPAGFNCQLMCNFNNICPNFSTCERLPLNSHNDNFRSEPFSEPFGVRPSPDGSIVVGFQSSSQSSRFYSQSNQKLVLKLALNKHPGAEFQTNVYGNSQFVEHLSQYLSGTRLSKLIDKGKGASGNLSNGT